MGKGKEGKRWTKGKDSAQIVKKPQTVDPKKHKSVNEISEVAALSRTSEVEQDDDSNASVDLNASRMDKASFEVARSQFVVNQMNH